MEPEDKARLALLLTILGRWSLQYGSLECNIEFKHRAPLAWISIFIDNTIQKKDNSYILRITGGPAEELAELLMDHFPPPKQLEIKELIAKATRPFYRHPQEGQSDPETWAETLARARTLGVPWPKAPPKDPEA